MFTLRIDHVDYHIEKGRGYCFLHNPYIVCESRDFPQTKKKSHYVISHQSNVMQKLRNLLHEHVEGGKL